MRFPRTLLPLVGVCILFNVASCLRAAPKPGDPLYCAPNEGAAAIILNGNVGIFTVNTDCYAGSAVTAALNQIVTQPAQGTLTNQGVAGGNAQYLYTLTNPSFTGTDTFTIHVTTSTNGSAGGPGGFAGGAGNVVITLNVIPATVQLSTAVSTSILVPIPAGSITGCPVAPVNGGGGPPAGTIYGCITSVTAGATAPAHGVLQVVGSTIRYVPTAGFSGTDTFTYEAHGIDDDATTALESGEVTVTVTVGNAAVPTPALTTWGMVILGAALLLFGMKAAGRYVPV